MYRTNIYLDEEQIRALRHLAAEEKCSVAELVRRAVDSYIATHLADQTVWRERLDEFVKRVQERQLIKVAPEAIEEDITSTRKEVRQARRATSSR